MTNLHNILRFHKDEPFLVNSIEQFMAVSFVVSAAATSHYKPAMNCIKATETHLYATNGHVLHVAENLSCLAVGLYYPVRKMKAQVWLVKSDEDGFPEIEKIIQMEVGGTVIQCHLSSHAVGNLAIVTKHLNSNSGEKVGYNSAYLQGASFLDGPVSIHAPKELQMAKIVSKDKSIFVMPMMLS